MQWDCLINTAWATDKQYTTTMRIGVHGGRVRVEHIKEYALRAQLDADRTWRIKAEMAPKPM
jgi:hypothetical protein